MEHTTLRRRERLLFRMDLYPPVFYIVSAQQMHLFFCGLFMPCVSLSLGQCGVGLFYCLKGAQKYASELYLPRLWNPLGL